MKIRARVADLICYDYAWSENGSFAKEVIIEVDDQASDITIARRVKDALGITGMRRDHWCCSDFGPWRDGCVGAYADIVEGGEE